MTTKATTEEKKKLEAKPQPKFDTSAYSCQIILERTTKEKAEDKMFPTDAFNVTYIVDGKEYLDVTRSTKMVNVFDMYCDRYGKTSVQNITYGAGTIRPNLWGAKAPSTKKKRKV
jgi:hypothetical protein